MSEDFPQPMEPRLRDRLDELFRSDSFAAGLGAELVEWDTDHAVVACTVADDQKNFVGFGHGGVAFSIADMAMGFLANADGRFSPGVQVDISYLRPVHAGDRLVATARVKHRSRRLMNFELDVCVDDRPVCTATGLCYRTEEWHFGADAWPDEWRASH